MYHRDILNETFGESLIQRHIERKVSFRFASSSNRRVQNRKRASSDAINTFAMLNVFFFLEEVAARYNFASLDDIMRYKIMVVVAA